MREVPHQMCAKTLCKLRSLPLSSPGIPVSELTEQIFTNMAKRPCPFEDNCAPQMKIHISTDDINRQNDAYMIEIQARTMAKLFEAANAKNKEASTEAEKPPCEMKTCPECSKKGELTSGCWFCELLLCQDCVRICVHCSEKFCSRCSVAIYKCGNNYTCLTCYN